MASKQNETFVGKLVFILTAVAMVEFFWWLLVLDHGVAAAH